MAQFINEVIDCFVYFTGRLFVVIKPEFPIVFPAKARGFIAKGSGGVFAAKTRGFFLCYKMRGFSFKEGAVIC